jgi:predicted CoA-substrate-specific enzyme activase
MKGGGVMYLGIDVGSVTTKFAVLDESDNLIASLYLPTRGEPVESVRDGLAQIEQALPAGTEIGGLAVTGSGRYLIGEFTGADLVKNEVTCHAVAAINLVPGVQTVIEIGGQDSKIIIIRDGLVTDFGMNTVCAAGTGSFLDHQAQRLHLDIADLGRRAARSRNPATIAGRCTVFAESEMIHRQQTGTPLDDVLYGLCRALAGNYLYNVGSGKDIRPPVVFQGGLAFNRGMVRALQAELDLDVIVPPHHEIMGAIGAARLIHGEQDRSRGPTGFRGFRLSATPN